MISDKFIAIFELIKNSYDAGAEKINVSFIIDDNKNKRIIISDNGCGMNYEDLINKWLFIAYSEKKHKSNTYREKIKREVAGAKGIGRLSCDRLGETLQLITKTASDSFAHKIDVNWNKFEDDDSQDFDKITVNYSTTNDLQSPFSQGTTLIIGNLREKWDRTAYIKLKHSLKKLISPDIDKGEKPFNIEIIVPSEKSKDDEQIKKEKKYKEQDIDREVVNGIIYNDIFERLNLKTTNIEVIVSEDGSIITSKLSDRGYHIFTIEEKNVEYTLLRDISVSVFYLNRSAKRSFTSQMGIEPVNYGSVFIYKNSFRINPYGDPGQDVFDIDRRKTQGYNRFLGTREIMGRISIKGSNEQFIETSSRAHGFINTPAVEMLAKMFREKVLKVLEKYVVKIIKWGEPFPNDPSKVIEPNEVDEKVVSQFISNVRPQNIISVEYNQDVQNKNLLKQPDSISSSLKKLEFVAAKSNDQELLGITKAIKKRTEAIISYNTELEQENEVKERDLEKAHKEKAIREKQVFFLKSAANQNVENLINGFHSVYTLTEVVRGNVNTLRELCAKNNIENWERFLTVLSRIHKANLKANKLAELAIKGNQYLKQVGNNSIHDFLKQYIDSGLVFKGLKFELLADDKPYNCRFDTSSVAIILDNIASNAMKARADLLQISLTETESNVKVVFTDNGIGLAQHIDPNLLFDWGVSTTDNKQGFGIGLYHIKSLVTEMKGSVYIDTNYAKGFRLAVLLKK